MPTSVMAAHEQIGRHNCLDPLQSDFIVFVTNYRLVQGWQGPRTHCGSSPDPPGEQKSCAGHDGDDRHSPTRPSSLLTREMDSLLKRSSR